MVNDRTVHAVDTLAPDLGMRLTVDWQKLYQSCSLDVLWCSTSELQLPAGELGVALGLDVARGEYIYRDIEHKRGAAVYLGASPRFTDPGVGA